MVKNCPICHSDKDIVLQDLALNRYGCAKCVHSFTIVSDDQRTCYNEEYYNAHVNWFNHPNYWLFNFIYSQIVSRVGRGGIKLLDIGCGKGDFLKHIRKRNAAMGLYGIDLCHNSYPGITFMQGDILSERIGMRFDAVTSFAAIEHVGEINLFIERLKSLLSPSGILVIMTDNTGGTFYAVARLLKKMGIKAPYDSLYELAHLQHFTNLSLRKLVESHDLDVIVQKNHNYPIGAINLPSCGVAIKLIYLCGARAIFALPSQFGILQTIICKRRVSG